MLKLYPLHLFFLVSILSATALRAELREWTSNDGRSITAEVVSLSDESGQLVVTMRRNDGFKFSIPVSRFSDRDQQILVKIYEEELLAASILKPDHRISIRLKLNRKTDRNQVYPGFLWTEDTDIFSPEVYVKNEELTQAFTGNTIRIVIVAKELETRNKFVIATAKTVEIDLPAREETVVEGGFFGLRTEKYNSNNSSYKWEYGYEKDDYVVLLINRDGEITHTRASSSKLLENIENVMGCRSGEVYSENLEHKLSSVPNIYFIKGD